MLLSELVPLVDAHQGVIYQMDAEETPRLRMLASYGNLAENGYPQEVTLGEGFVGQCALDRRRILVTNIPGDTVPVGAGLFHALPRSVVIFPIIFEGEIRAVLGIASLQDFAPAHLTFLDQLTTSVGIVFNSIEATMQTEGLLKQSQQLASELQFRQKELQQTNEQLALKAQQLAEQNAEVERKNQQIEQARRALEEKASELALTSKYKSEFLANMSHELRTPLNSILILGQQLGDNPDGNLSAKQVEFARSIHGAGTDLLNLITDILDLSKIESGTVTVEAEEIYFTTLLETVRRTFRHEAENRRLSFDVQVDPQLGSTMVTDPKRLQQVLKNLLSNAFKFTEHGGVRLNVALATGGWSLENYTLRDVPSVVSFEVSDTGVGIPPEKQKIVFEAFQQADASTSRKYGGTGLGLAISRELAHLLGGEIQLRSTPGRGSTFTLYLPLSYAGPSVSPDEGEPDRVARTVTRYPSVRLPERSMEKVPDDRESIQPGDTTILIVEDDPHYARVIVDLAHDDGFKVLVAHRGMDALELARQYHPTAVSLDVFLPDMLGWTVLSHLKQDPATRHIPVQIVTLDEDRQHGLARGAFAFLTKPTTSDGLEAALHRIKEYSTPRKKRLLVVEDDPLEQRSIAELLGHDDVEIESAVTAADALVALRTSVSTARWSTCGSPTCRGSRCWSDCVTTRRSAISRWSSSPGRSYRPRRTHSSTRWRGASS
jgi:signal transduction histidine kinase/DNA-binding response OmpR family regulator